MAKTPGKARAEIMSDALEQLRSALALLDEAGAPSEIGAKVDLAIHELFLALADLSARGTLTQGNGNAAGH
jgi:hypothetical protein